MDKNDPLQNPSFKAPGLLEKLREAFLGISRPFDCIQVEVTSCCMGECLYCPHAAQAKDWNARHMSSEIYAKLWPLLRNSQRAHLQGWGEPLLHPSFFQFAALAQKAGCQVSTTSCGQIMTEEIAEKIMTSGMDLIAFSLAGTDEGSNSARKGISFARVCQSIECLRKAIGPASKRSPEIHLAYILLADRMDAARELPALMEMLDVEMTVVSTLDYLALPEQRELAFAPHEKEKIERARSILEEISRAAEKNGRIIYYSLPGSTPMPDAGGCRENVARSLYIDADGNVSPCVYLNVPGNDPASRRKNFGNVLHEDPLAIWKKEAYREFRDALVENRPDAVCETCPKRLEC